MSDKTLKLENQHPQLKALTALIKISDLLGPQTIKIDKKTGDVIHQVVISKMVHPTAVGKPKPRRR